MTRAVRFVGGAALGSLVVAAAAHAFGIVGGVGALAVLAYYAVAGYRGRP